MRLDGIREVFETTLFNTLLWPEGQQTIDVERVSLLMGGYQDDNENTYTKLPSDMSFTLGRLRAVFFLKDALLPSEIAALQFGIRVTPMTNELEVRKRPVRHFNLTHVIEQEKTHRARPSLEICYQAGPFGVLARQTFWLDLLFSQAARDIINQSASPRYVRFYCDGVVARDVC